VQNSFILGRNWRQEIVWRRVGSGNQGESKDHQGSNKNHAGQTEKVCRCEEETPRVQCGGSSIREGSPVEEYFAVQIEREASSPLHRTF